MKLWQLYVSVPLFQVFQSHPFLKLTCLKNKGRGTTPGMQKIAFKPGTLQRHGYTPCEKRELGTDGDTVRRCVPENSSVFSPLLSVWCPDYVIYAYIYMAMRVRPKCVCVCEERALTICQTKHAPRSTGKSKKKNRDKNTSFAFGSHAQTPHNVW